MQWERHVVGLEPVFPFNPEYVGYCTAVVSYDLMATLHMIR